MQRGIGEKIVQRELDLTHRCLQYALYHRTGTADQWERGCEINEK